MSQALTVFPYYADLIASGRKTLELRTRRLLRPGQKIVICAGAPESCTRVLVQCVAVHKIADLPLARVLRDACIPSLDPRWKFALELKVIRLLPPRKVRGLPGVFTLRGEL